MIEDRLPKPKFSPLFIEIVRNDYERAEEKAMPVISFDRMKRLIIERRDYRRAAEKALQWNTNKGNTA